MSANCAPQRPGRVRGPVRRGRAVRPSADTRTALRIRESLLRAVLAAAMAAATAQLLLRLVAFTGIDQATRCVFLAGRLARAGIALAIVSVSPDCPAEAFAPGGDFRHVLAWSALGAFTVGLIYAGTSVPAQRACRFAAGLSRVWHRLPAFAGSPACASVTFVGRYPEPDLRPRRMCRQACGLRGPPSFD